jgi:hypothetical protein
MSLFKPCKRFKPVIRCAALKPRLTPGFFGLSGGQGDKGPAPQLCFSAIMLRVSRKLAGHMV